MAFTPTTPTTGQIPQPAADQDLDKAHFHTVTFGLIPNEPGKTKVVLEWSEGYMDEGNYIKVKDFKQTFDAEQDADLLAALNAATTGGTMYNELKTALWDFLQTKNLIGAGTIS